MKRLIAAFARNTVFANIVLLLIFAGGGVASFSLVRETFPEFSLDMFTITVPYPGADPEEVEEGVVRKIEEALGGVEGIRRYTTYSSEHIGTAVIEIKRNYKVSDVMDRVRTRVDTVSTFPVNAEKPIYTEIVNREGVILLSLSGGISEHRLKEWAEGIKDEIRLIPEISQVDIFGARDYEITIEVSEERLREYGLTFSQVADTIRSSNMNLGGGTIRTQGEEIRVRTIGRKYTGEELASIVVLARPTGEIVTLAHLAGINDGFTEDPVLATVNGVPSLFLTVAKTQGEDSLTISEAVQDFVAKKQRQLPEGMKIEILYDNTEMLRSRIDLLVENAIMGLLLVFLLLWIFTDKHLSFWVGMGIPVAISGAMVVLWASGNSINMMSLFGLIAVSGMLVDDAIVVGEAIFTHRSMGKPPLQAAVDGLCEVGVPVICAVLTTIVAFIPLCFVSGTMGNLISVLPIVVIACLMTSLVECLILLPAHLNSVQDPNTENGKTKSLIHPLKAFRYCINRGFEWFVEHIYTLFLKKALYWRYILVCIFISIFLLTFGLIQGGILKFEMLPEIDGFIITSNVEFPNGTPLGVTQDAVKQMDTALTRLAQRTKTRSGDPLVIHQVSIAGQSFGDAQETGPHLGSVQAILLDSERRGIHSKDIAVAWEKEVGPISGATSLTFEDAESGPGGAPIEVWFQGKEMDTILAAADDLMARLRQFEGVHQVRSDFRAGKNEIRLELKPEARALGLTVGDLARQVYAGYYGEEAVRLQRGRDDIRVKVRYTEDERNQMSDLQQVRIRTQEGYQVPLLSVADVSVAPGYSTITRTNGWRRVMVSADVDSNKANAGEVLDDLSKNLFPQLRAKYPGLFISLQGEQKETQETFDSLVIGYPLVIIGIFVVMASIFRSYAQPLVIMFTVPFGLVGAFLGHLLLGYNISLLSAFGVVALTGVVVNDAIVLIDCINANLAEGMNFFSAITQGATRRFRAVFLTTATTVGGLGPLIMETDFQAKFLIPMALSIAAGLAFATVLTLLLIPGLLVVLNDLRCLFYWLKHRTWPTREEVEPAHHRHKEFLPDEVLMGESPTAIQ